MIKKSNFELLLNKVYILIILWLPPAEPIFKSFIIGQRVVFFLTVIVIIMLLLFASLKKILMTHYFILLIIGVVFFVSFYFSMTTLLFAESIGIGDFVDFVRPIFYFIFLLPSIFFPIPKEQFDNFLKFILVNTLIQILFSLLVFFPFTYPLVNLYKGRTSNSLVIFHFYRFSGTFGFPGDFGFFLALIGSVVYYRLGSGDTNRLMLWLLFILITLSILFTGSRAALAVYVLVLFFVSFQIRIYKKWWLWMLLIILSVNVIYLLSSDDLRKYDTKYFSPYYILQLVNKGVNDDSARHRVKEIVISSELIIKYFPLGFGANRHYFKKIIGPLESAYGYYGGKFGFLGLLMFLLHILYFGFLARKVAQYEYRFRYIFYVLSVWIFCIPIIGMFSAFSDRFKDPIFFYYIGGLLISWFRKENSARSNCRLENKKLIYP